MVLIDPLPSIELSETSSAEIPADYLAGRHDLGYKLGLELRSLCSIRNDLKFCILVLFLCYYNWMLYMIENGIRVEVYLLFYTKVFYFRIL